MVIIILYTPSTKDVLDCLGYFMAQTMANLLTHCTWIFIVPIKNPATLQAWTVKDRCILYNSKPCSIGGNIQNMFILFYLWYYNAISIQRITNDVCQIDTRGKNELQFRMPYLWIVIHHCVWVGTLKVPIKVMHYM